MTVKVSQLLGMDVYTDNAQYVGKVFDAIIDLQTGEVSRLTLEPIKAISKDDAKRIFREKTVLYKSVKAVERIIIVGSQSVAEPESMPEPEQTKPLPYSARYRR